MSFVVSRSTLTIDLAQRAIAAGLEFAASEGIAVGIAVVGVAGDLVAFARMDDATLLAESAAREKAYTTAVTGGLPTDVLSSSIAAAPAMVHGISTMERVTIVGGGVPVLVDGGVVGAIGVSGGASESQDVAVARHVAKSAQRIAEGQPAE